MTSSRQPRPDLRHRDILRVSARTPIPRQGRSAAVEPSIEGHYPGSSESGKPYDKHSECCGILRLLAEPGCLEQAWVKYMQEFAIRHGKQGWIHWRLQSTTSCLCHSPTHPSSNIDNRTSSKGQANQQKRLEAGWNLLFEVAKRRTMLGPAVAVTQAPQTLLSHQTRVPLSTQHSALAFFLLHHVRMPIHHHPGQPARCSKSGPLRATTS
jgi:hypothetical protein